jgi:hypothetical protein
MSAGTGGGTTCACVAGGSANVKAMLRAVTYFFMSFPFRI